jgi:hypothetical protein
VGHATPIKASLPPARPPVRPSAPLPHRPTARAFAGGQKKQKSKGELRPLRLAARCHPRTCTHLYGGSPRRFSSAVLLGGSPRHAGPVIDFSRNKLHARTFRRTFENQTNEERMTSPAVDKLPKLRDEFVDPHSGKAKGGKAAIAFYDFYWKSNHYLLKILLYLIYLSGMKYLDKRKNYLISGNIHCPRIFSIFVSFLISLCFSTSYTNHTYPFTRTYTHTKGFSSCLFFLYLIRLLLNLCLWRKSNVELM